MQFPELRARAAAAEADARRRQVRPPLLVLPFVAPALAYHCSRWDSGDMENGMHLQMSRKTLGTVNTDLHVL